MAKITQATPSLSSLRNQIDEIDIKIHDLLMDRVKIVKQVGLTKARSGDSIFRPAREAQMLRKIKQRHCGPFSFPATARIWREIIGASLSIESDFVVSVYVPEPVTIGLAYIALAKNHFGAETKLLYAQTEAGVLRAVRDGKACVGILPIPSDNHTKRASAEPWWYTLAVSGDNRPNILASLPWLNDPNDGQEDINALAIGRTDPEISNIDATFIAFESTDNISRDRIRKEAEQLGLPIDWAATWADNDQGNRWQLAEIDGFILNDDERVKELFSIFDYDLIRSVNLGSYAKPEDTVEIS